MHKPLYTDDAFMGVIARDLGVPVREIPGFSLYGVPKNTCQFSTTVAMGHDITPKNMLFIQETYERLAITKEKTC